jgi:murein L,D-transpeptidase YcbB/YkuD
MRSSVTPLLWILCLAAATVVHADDTATLLIAARVGQIRNGASVVVAGRTLASTAVLPDFYEKRGFAPAWADAQNLDALVEAVDGSVDDGLLPEDYHAGALAELRATASSPERDADLDLLATDAVVRLAYHLRLGKVDPTSLDRSWNLGPDFERALTPPPSAVLQEALDQHRIAETLDGLRPKQRLYGALRDALARYRAIEDAGGWPSLTSGPNLEPGASDSRVPVLRRRLEVEGDLDKATTAADHGGTASEDETYDEELVVGVKRFQQRHGLHADGILGPATLRALNVSVATRIAELRLSLERGRLILHDLPGRLVVVNVPAFRVYYADGQGRRFAANAIVGKTYAKTPIFRAEIDQIVVNPSWTIPPGIMRRDVLPGLRKDPNYLKAKGFKRVGEQIVQPPGPNNALGRMKINFPNSHLVYMHDTPQRDLFDRDARAFSSGCIRVQNVVELAALLLDDPIQWPKESLEAAIETGRTRFVPLPQRVPILIVYWTASAGLGDGRVYFYDDIYGRDPPALAALDAPFRFRNERAALPRP